MQNARGGGVGGSIGLAWWARATGKSLIYQVYIYTTIQWLVYIPGCYV